MMSFPCREPGCGKTFTHDRNRRRHERLHQDQRPHVCPESGCGKCFARRSDLTIHLTCHSAARPFACGYPGCTWQFRRRADMLAHQRRHTRGDTAQAIVSKTRGVGSVGSSAPDVGSATGLTTTASNTNFTFPSIETAVPAGRLIVAAPASTTPATLLPVALVAKPKNYLEIPLPPNEEHVHGVGCGHRIVVHEDHLDFLDNGQLHHLSTGGRLFLHQLDELYHPSFEDLPSFLQISKDADQQLPAQLCKLDTRHPHVHHDEHVHGDDCGHEAVLHGSHIDYLVDGSLHSSHKGHCDFHGVLNSFSNDNSIDPSLEDLMGFFGHL